MKTDTSEKMIHSMLKEAYKTDQKHLLFLSPTNMHQWCLSEPKSASHTHSLHKMSTLVQAGSWGWELTARVGKELEIFMVELASEDFKS